MKNIASSNASVSDSGTGGIRQPSLNRYRSASSFASYIDSDNASSNSAFGSLDFGLNQATGYASFYYSIRSFIAQLRNIVFGILVVMMKEEDVRKRHSHKWFYFSSIVDVLQVLSFPLDPRFNSWGGSKVALFLFDIFSYFASVGKVATFSNFFYLLILRFCYAIILLSMIDAIYVGWTYSKVRDDMLIWPLMMLRFFVGMYVTVFYVPILTVFVFQFTLSDTSILDTIISILCLGFFLPLASVTKLVYIQCRPRPPSERNRDFGSMAHGRIECFHLLYKTLMVFIFLLVPPESKYNGWVVFFTLSIPILLWFARIIYLPFYHKITNRFFVGFNSVIVWACICMTLAYLFTTDSDSELLGIIFSVFLPFSFIFGYKICGFFADFYYCDPSKYPYRNRSPFRWLFRKFSCFFSSSEEGDDDDDEEDGLASIRLSSSPKNNISDEEDKEDDTVEVNTIEYGYDERIFTSKWFDSLFSPSDWFSELNTRFLQEHYTPINVSIAEQIFSTRLEQDSSENSPILAVQYARFCDAFRGDVSLSHQIILMARHCDPPFDFLFFIFQQIEMRQRQTKGDSGLQDTDVITHIQLNKGLSVGHRRHLHTLELLVSFWRTLLNDEIDLGVLDYNITQIVETLNIAHTTLTSLLKNHHDSSRVLRSLARFVEEIQGDEWEAAQLYQRADTLDDIQSKRNTELYEAHSNTKFVPATPRRLSFSDVPGRNLKRYNSDSGRRNSDGGTSSPRDRKLKRFNSSSPTPTTPADKIVRNLQRMTSSNSDRSISPSGARIRTLRANSLPYTSRQMSTSSNHSDSSDGSKNANSSPTHGKTSPIRGRTSPIRGRTSPAIARGSPVVRGKSPILKTSTQNPSELLQRVPSLSSLRGISSPAGGKTIEEVMKGLSAVPTQSNVSLNALERAADFEGIYIPSDDVIDDSKQCRWTEKTRDQWRATIKKLQSQSSDSSGVSHFRHVAWTFMFIVSLVIVSNCIISVVILDRIDDKIAAFSVSRDLPVFVFDISIKTRELDLALRNSFPATSQPQGDVYFPLSNADSTQEEIKRLANAFDFYHSDIFHSYSETRLSSFLESYRIDMVFLESEFSGVEVPVTFSHQKYGLQAAALMFSYHAVNLASVNISTYGFPTLQYNENFFFILANGPGVLADALDYVRVKAAEDLKNDANILIFVGASLFCAIILLIGALGWFTFRPAISLIAKEKEATLRLFLEIPHRIVTNLATQFEGYLQLHFEESTANEKKDFSKSKLKEDKDVKRSSKRKGKALINTSMSYAFVKLHFRYIMALTIISIIGAVLLIRSISASQGLNDLHTNISWNSRHYFLQRNVRFHALELVSNSSVSSLYMTPSEASLLNPAEFKASLRSDLIVAKDALFETHNALVFGDDKYELEGYKTAFDLLGELYFEDVCININCVSLNYSRDDYVLSASGFHISLLILMSQLSGLALKDGGYDSHYFYIEHSFDRVIGDCSTYASNLLVGGFTEALETARQEQLIFLGVSLAVILIELIVLFQPMSIQLLLHIKHIRTMFFIIPPSVLKELPKILAFILSSEDDTLKAETASASTVEEEIKPPLRRLEKAMRRSQLYDKAYISNFYSSVVWNICGKQVKPLGILRRYLPVLFVLLVVFTLIWWSPIVLLTTGFDIINENIELVISAAIASLWSATPFSAIAVIKPFAQLLGFDYFSRLTLFMIQFVSLSAASAFYLLGGYIIDFKVVVHAGRAAVLGAFVSSFIPSMASDQSYMVLTSIWAGCSFALIFAWWQIEISTLRRSLPDNVFMFLELSITGFLGGLFSYTSGATLSFFVFTLIAVSYRMKDRIAIPTCIIVGFFLSLANICIMAIMPSEVDFVESGEIALACVPVIVPSTLISALLVKHLPPMALRLFFYSAILLNFVLSFFTGDDGFQVIFITLVMTMVFAIVGYVMFSGGLVMTKISHLEQRITKNVEEVENVEEHKENKK